MKKLFSILVVALALGGCAQLQADFAKIQGVFETVTTATVSPAVAQVAVSSFEIIEGASTQYFIYCKTNLQTPPCAAGTVANPGPLRIAIKYVRVGRNARDKIKAAGKSGALISTATYNLLVDAITQLRTTAASGGQ